jgi:hypothetical protein
VSGGAEKVPVVPKKITLVDATGVFLFTHAVESGAAEVFVLSYIE